MSISETISGRIGTHHIRQICALCSGEVNDSMKAELFSLINAPDDRTAYNAMWVFTHFAPTDMAWLRPKRNDLIDLVLTVGHEGKRRLLLTLLEHQTIGKDDIRLDYLDFCLSRINSTETVRNTGIMHGSRLLHNVGSTRNFWQNWKPKWN